MLFGRGAPVLLLDLLERANRGEVVRELDGLGALAELDLVGNDEVDSRDVDRGGLPDFFGSLLL